MGVSPLLLKIIICVDFASMMIGSNKNNNNNNNNGSDLTIPYIKQLVVSPYGAVFVALLAIFWYLASETDDEIAADGQLNIFLLVLFSCLALLPDPRKNITGTTTTTTA